MYVTYCLINPPTTVLGTTNFWLTPFGPVQGFCGFDGYKWVPSTYLQTQNDEMITKKISPLSTGAIFVNSPFPAKEGGGGRERLRNF